MQKLIVHFFATVAIFGTDNNEEHFQFIGHGDTVHVYMYFIKDKQIR